MIPWIIVIIESLLLIFGIIKLKRKKCDGFIRINQSDPNKDTYTLELGIPFGELDNRKEVIFQIVKE